MRFSTRFPAQTTARAALLAALAVPAFAAQATEYAKVVSSTPVISQVAVPRQACSNEQQLVRQSPSGGGALLGAIAGGVIGNAFGHGIGRAASTGAGVLAGSVIGNQVEANGAPVGEVTVQHCQPVAAYESRTVGYDVVYEYAGQRYTTRLASDPGERLAVDVNPAGAAASPPPAAAYDDGYQAAPPAVYAPPVRVGMPVPAATVFVAPYYGWRPRRFWY